MKILAELDVNTLSNVPKDVQSNSLKDVHVNVFNFKDMKRNSLKLIRNSLNSLEFKREKSLFPNVFLPSGSFTRVNSSNILILKQIRELFHLPVPAVYLGATSSEWELDEFYGVHLEFSLRNLILNDPLDWDRVTGTLGKSNELKEKIGFDLEKELKILNKPKSLETRLIKEVNGM
jgi:hypothetical protein